MHSVGCRKNYKKNYIANNTNMKKYLIAFALLFAALPAHAAVNITSVEDQTVTVGETVTVEVVVNRTGILFQNDWQSTEIAGVCFNTPDLTVGTGVATTSYDAFVATTTGMSSVSVKVFRFNGCDDNFGLAGTPAEDETTFELTVEEVVVPTPSSGSSKNKSGGGYGSASYYGFTSEADKARWANYDERQKMLGEWRYRMCQEVGFACGK